jgi:hypothetical protein
VKTRAKSNKSPPEEEARGIAALPAARTFMARKAAKELFDLVSKEQGSTEQLRQLVRHESLLELMLMCIDLTKSARARVAATAKRRQHPIVALIHQLARDKPRISAKELERSLEALVGKGVVYNVTETALEPEDTNFKPIPLTGLKDHLTRAKKKIAKAG